MSEWLQYIGAYDRLYSADLRLLLRAVVVKEYPLHAAIGVLFQWFEAVLLDGKLYYHTYSILCT